MTFQYCSDLHLEFRENKQFLDVIPIQPRAEILLLAGDIVPFVLMNKKRDFFDYVSDRFKYTYWIPGNHEYYYADASERSGVLYEKIRDNVLLVNNVSIQLPLVKLVFSTMWTHISPARESQIERSLSDFHVITYMGKKFTPGIYNQMHRDSLEFIKNETKEAGRKIVVTHHVPTRMNYPPQYKNGALNEAFAVELFDFIEPSGIERWIFGHHHCNIPDFRIGGTIMTTNQLGYVKSGEHMLFDPDKTFTIR